LKVINKILSSKLKFLIRLLNLLRNQVILGVLILRKIIKKIAQYISRTNQYTIDEEEQIEYALRILVFEILKAFGLIIIFSLIGYSFQAIVAIGTMILLRPFIGGYHEDTQIKCFTATLIIIGSIIYLSINLHIDLISKQILNGASLYCIWHQAPIINPKMLLTKPNLLKRNRIIGISFTLIFVLVSILLYKYTLVSNTILWTIVFQALLMFNKRDIQKSSS
jgi:accessory gene regulator B